MLLTQIAVLTDREITRPSVDPRREVGVVRQQVKITVIHATAG
jgi:hypothetical protein